MSPRTQMRDKLTVERAREVLDYDPETGHFLRKVRLAQRHQVGDRADRYCASGGMLKGYYVICVDSIKYLAHRVAWLYTYGQWPELFIDHINGNKGDNRIENLREATNSLNQLNIHKPQKNNRAGLRGAHQHTATSWRCKVGFRGRYYDFGLFSTPEAAHRAYVLAKSSLQAGISPEEVKTQLGLPERRI